ncbi:MAG: hypothetical protein IV090_26440 [Candidatus Sericytochromatia bacterium]|nr:hypothetical protein [Candidatus Sericytochromatia bacterium]
MGDLSINIDSINLTKNEDIWSKSVRDNVLVSAYPLALWIASSWWRLLYESLPHSRAKFLTDWRMSHELTAANEGFIWPRLIFASDKEVMQIWAPHQNVYTDNQSVRYLNHLNKPSFLKIYDFIHEIDSFINSVLSRLNEMGLSGTDLQYLWQEINEEKNDVNLFKYRRLEAELGFDAGEAPEDIVNQAIELSKRIGDNTFSEIIPSYSRVDSDDENPLDAIDSLLQTPGIIGNPSKVQIEAQSTEQHLFPWQQAKSLANSLRRYLGVNDDHLIEDSLLYDLLGFAKQEIEAYSAPRGQTITLANPIHDNNQLQFHIRKNHPLARRFELARLIGDYLFYGNIEQNWLASTETKTSRQKFQRAFAAEFLSPVSGLLSFVKSDFSETALEDVAGHFKVSERTVETILINNRILEPHQSSLNLEPTCPY